MATKKKRSRGLGGSPEHHRSEAKALTSAARDFYGQSSLASQRGMCDSALVLLRSGDSDAGRAFSHVLELSPDAQSPAWTEMKTATKYFKKHCAVSRATPALSGMKRRSRR